MGREAYNETHLGPARFSVDGKGTNEKTLKGVHHLTASVDPPSIATVTRGSVNVTITGLAVGDAVILEPPSNLNDDLLFVGYSIAADTLTIYLYNPTAGAIDDTAKTWRITWFDLT